MIKHFILEAMLETFCHRRIQIAETGIYLTSKLEDVNCDECYDEMKKALNTWRLLKYE